jgi:hypothetical protein
MTTRRIWASIATALLFSFLLWAVTCVYVEEGLSRHKHTQDQERVGFQQEVPFR